MRALLWGRESLGKEPVGWAGRETSLGGQSWGGAAWCGEIAPGTVGSRPIGARSCRLLSGDKASISRGNSCHVGAREKLVTWALFL